MASVIVHCPRCQSAQVYRHGQNPKGHAQFHCRDYHRVFQLTYTYEAHNRCYRANHRNGFQRGQGRDTTRTLKVGINTIIWT